MPHLTYDCDITNPFGVEGIIPNAQLSAFITSTTQDNFLGISFLSHTPGHATPLVTIENVRQFIANKGYTSVTNIRVSGNSSLVVTLEDGTESENGLIGWPTSPVVDYYIQPPTTITVTFRHYQNNTSISEQLSLSVDTSENFKIRTVKQYADILESLGFIIEPLPDMLVSYITCENSQTGEITKTVVTPSGFGDLNGVVGDLQNQKTQTCLLYTSPSPRDS